ncbi:MAG TPA: 7-carboxy-7-deazaguanine synthase QueE [Candidatus Eremiobacteraceae bacterium]|nr:7-carboxy-7-deazaguanine synthase QueE [Candidatus Eremiobacteraceae bacterium]
MHGPERVPKPTVEKFYTMLAVSTLKVSETFSSVQGEGSLVGSASFFIRLDGCPLRCSWCDTPYALEGDSGRLMSIDDLASLARSFRRIVVTGGEPLAQDIRPLVDRLTPRHHVTVETSGAIFADLPKVSLFSLSPKVGSSGYKPKIDVLRKYCASAAGRMHLKFVIADFADLDEAFDCLARIENDLPASTPVILQPESRSAGRGDDYNAALRRIAERVVNEERWRRFDVRVLPQLHYLMWGGEPGR